LNTLVNFERAELRSNGQFSARVNKHVAPDLGIIRKAALAKLSDGLV
jgi:hypothetical protein